MTGFLASSVFSFVAIGFAIAVAVIAILARQRTGNTGWLLVAVHAFIHIATSLLGLFQHYRLMTVGVAEYGRLATIFGAVQFIALTVASSLLIVGLAMIAKPIAKN